MSTTTQSPSPSSSSDESTPLLTTTTSRSRQLRGAPSLRGAARFLRRASSRRMLREPSMRVRESATEQIEERQSDWAYSRPIVILDIIWNLAFIIISVSVLVMSRNEDPNTPLRLWIVGYACQCLLHMVCVRMEYKQRYQHQQQQREVEVEGSDGSGREYADVATDRDRNNNNNNINDDDDTRYNY